MNVTLKTGGIAAARFLTAFAVALWIGGMTFFGAVAAPVLFSEARKEGVPTIAPVMVGLMLGRFSFVTFACSGILLLAWGIEAKLLKPRAGAKRWFMIQGAGTVICVLLGVYLGVVLLPQTQAAQSVVLPIFNKKEHHQPLSPDEAGIMAKFEAGHQTYELLAEVNLWLGVALLALVSARATYFPVESEQAGMS